MRTVEVELAGKLHVELALADQVPGEPRAAQAPFDRRADGIDGARDRRERGAEVTGLFGRQTFGRFVRRADHAAGRGPADDLP